MIGQSWYPHAFAIVALAVVAVTGLFHPALAISTAISGLLFAAVLYRADEPRRFLLWWSAVLFPFALMATIVTVAGPPSEVEAVWMQGRFWAISRERVEHLSRLLFRMSGFVAVGWYAATHASKGSIERFVAQLGLPSFASELLVSAVATRSLVLDLAKTLAEQQQLRGIPVVGSIRQRLQSAALMTLPLAAELFTEAAASSASRERRVALQSLTGIQAAREPIEWRDVLAVGLSIVAVFTLVLIAL